MVYTGYCAGNMHLLILNYMKRFTFVCVFLGLHGLLSAQHLPQSYISLSAGSSAPVGRYAASTELYNDGFARPGSVIALDWAKYYACFGISATVSFANHKLNQAALTQAFGPYNVTPHYNDSSRWMSSCVMAGPSWGYRTGRWTFDLRALGGFYFAKAPYIEVQEGIILPDKTQKFDNKKYDCVGALGYNIGACVRYNFSKRWFVNGRVNFYHAKPFYAVDYQQITPKYGYQTYHYEFYQKTSVSDVTIGIGYDLGKLRF